MLAHSYIKALEILEDQRQQFPGSTFYICENALGWHAVLTDSELNLSAWSQYKIVQKVSPLKGE